ncbi:putative membrane protein [Orientia tsutsugamushi str. Gilliam]|uniref:Putative membrane protein n=1 Tax=Orientia tsutsugamushi str. Gilliam TaxID=1359184 RepID=A0A0F3MDC3_ORITS|nr:putative membrane protein [Orientia tsutsugamushi str. Gilliam]
MFKEQLTISTAIGSIIIIFSAYLINVTPSNSKAKDL